MFKRSVIFLLAACFTTGPRGGQEEINCESRGGTWRIATCKAQNDCNYECYYKHVLIVYSLEGAALWAIHDGVLLFSP